MPRIFHIAVLVVSLCLVALVADSWLAARRTAAQLNSRLTAQNILIDQTSERENRRATELAQALAAIAQQKRSVQSPRQAADAIPLVMPRLPLPIVVHVPDLIASSTSPQQNVTTAPDATISVPQADLKPLYDALQDCRACALERDAAKKDLADKHAELAATIKQRDAALTAARGGNFWSHIKSATKWLIIGAVAGAAAEAAASRSLGRNLHVNAPGT